MNIAEEKNKLIEEIAYLEKRIAIENELVDKLTNALIMLDEEVVL